tara:strand:+ start:278 stop:748 length:471 start_codon:yes stop_codon:yes gene_type:complete
MVKSVKIASPKVVNTTKVRVPAPVVINKKATTKELIVSGNEITYDQIDAFVKANAGGNEANVLVEPLPNVDFKSKTPVPFGYGGKNGGVRDTLQNWILNGVEGDRTLKTILTKCRTLGLSRRKPVCLWALMHGGYSRSSKYWLTPYVKLVVKPQSK